MADPPEELGGPPEGLPGEPGWPLWLLEELLCCPEPMFCCEPG